MAPLHMKYPSRRDVLKTLGALAAKTAAASAAVLKKAIDCGVRFFDNARNYGGGRAEELYGKFLIPEHRDKIFLMTKSTGKTKEAVNRRPRRPRHGILQTQDMNLPTKHCQPSLSGRDVWHVPTGHS